MKGQLIEQLEPESPLIWPEDFPPQDRWGRFFLGIRGLGPDLSFFRALATTQGKRTAELLMKWPDEDRARVLFLGELLKEYAGWPTPYFLPGDQFMVIAYGPRFQDLDELLFGSFVTALNDEIVREIPDRLWNTFRTAIFSEVVAALRPYLQV